MIDYPVLWLALEDFLPVVFFAVGLLALTRLSQSLDGRAGRLVAAALALTVGSGITKPIYKVILALSGGDVELPWLSDVLFWGLAPGFVLLAAGLRRARRIGVGDPSSGARWARPTAAVVVVLAAVLGVLGSDAWFVVLLFTTTVANVVVVVELVAWSRSAGERVAAWLFVGSLLVVFALAGAAAALDQTVANQWIEQIVSTAGQGMFMVASLRLANAVGGVRIALRRRRVPLPR